MSVGYKQPVGSRQALDNKASSGTIEPGQIYLISDEDRLAVGLTASSYQAFLKEGEPTLYPTMINSSGRVYCYADGRWVTNADDNYGTSYYQYTESGGTGADPIFEWEHKGDYVRAGTVMHELAIVGRVLDAGTIADVEIVVVYTNPQGKWQDAGTGLDGDEEDAHTIIAREFWTDTFTGIINDERERVLDLGGFVVPANGDIRIYFRPVNVDPRPNTTTDYIQVFYSFGLSIESFT